MNVSVSGFGNGMLALLRHPEQLQRLRNDPSLIPAAVEELLRFDSPIQADFRRVLADCEVNGFALRKRDNVVLLLGAANRDPDVFEALFGESVNRDVELYLVSTNPERHVSGWRGSVRRGSEGCRKQSESTRTQARTQARAPWRVPGTRWPVVRAAESRFSRRSTEISSSRRTPMRPRFSGFW